MLLPYLLFIAGLLLIIKGGDIFVDSSTWIAKATRLPEVLIGATIVSLATTFPETMVSVISATGNQPAMAIGNAIGSTICNTGLILGLYSIIKPSKVGTKIFLIKGTMLVMYIGAFWLLASVGVVGRRTSLLLLFMLAIFIAANFAIAGYKKSQNRHQGLTSVSSKDWLPQIAKFVIGITLIIVGSNLLVTHGVTIASLWGVPEAVISLTLIALGTSLPELVTAVTSLLKGHAALSIGNIIGANILNISMVIGISALFRPLQISRQNLYLDIPTSLLINLCLVLPTIFFKKITRLQGLVMLSLYGLYIMLVFYINISA